MEGLGDIHHGVCAHGGLVGELEGHHPGLIGLPGQRHHLELHIEQFGKVLRRAQRRIRQVAEGLGGDLQFLHATLDLAYRVQVVGDDGAVAAVELAFEVSGRLLCVVEQAPLGVDDRAAFLV